jgi:Tol biopolymer transport system component/predicted Ser/Thr protein kinase
MQARAGDKYGAYELLSPLGEGGMGEVWKAYDPRVRRAVAVKIAKELFQDRFEREARAVAALNHPHICQLYDVGPNYLVMEYVEGAPLRGPLAIDKAIGYGRQILEALEAAHRHGIVHRDLKPTNILVGKAGVKLLDFGLAKGGVALEGEATVTEALTGQGQIVGTLQYMSPEQLQGKFVDARSDLFAFGCVFYEMVSGERAFIGESTASVIAAILERPPKTLRVPAGLRHVLEGCLEKDPERRFQTAVDVRRALEFAMAGPEEALDRPVASRRAFVMVATGLTSAVAGAVAGTLATRRWWRSNDVEKRPRGLLRVTTDGVSIGGTISGDGKFIAYSSWLGSESNLELMVRQVDGGGAVRLTEEPGSDAQPVFHPDGSKLYFRSARAGGGIYVVPSLGGEARLVVPAGIGPSISQDGKKLAYLVNRELRILDLDSKEDRLLPGNWIEPLYWSADGRQLLGFETSAAQIDLCRIDVASGRIEQTGLFDNLNRLKMLIPATFGLCGWANGKIYIRLYFGDSYGVWSLGEHECSSGLPQAVLQTHSTSVFRGDVRGSKLVYGDSRTVDSVCTVECDLDGGGKRGAVVRQTTDQIGGLHQDLSRDGRWLAYVSRKNGGQSMYVRDLSSGKETMVGEARRGDSGFSHLQFSPDARKIAYGSHNSTMVWDIEHGKATQVADRFLRVRGWSPDGRFLLGFQRERTSGIGVVEIASKKFVSILADKETVCAYPRLSPDGRHFVCKVGARVVVYPFRGLERVAIEEGIAVTETGELPFWSPGGKAICWLRDASPGTNLLVESPEIWRRGFDGTRGSAAGNAELAFRLEGEQLLVSITNQLVAASGRLAFTSMSLVSDLWLKDLEE